MDLIDRSAGRLAADVSSGEVSVREVVGAYLERIERLQPLLNTFTLVHAERSVARAARLDERRSRGERLGPLAGVPVAVKDLIDEAGVPTTCGSSFYRKVPEEDAPVIERLESAGAVSIGRAGLHEFAYGFSSENDWWGPVRNPWDPNTSPGGSSGGSAASVAARMAPVSLGTDTGGSVRVPAALCGIVGLKVTHGRVPLRGVFPLVSSVDTVGPLARSVADAALVYAAIAGFDPHDPWSVNREVEYPAGPAPLTGLKVGVPRPWVDQPTDPIIAGALSSFLDALADHGALVEEPHAPQLQAPGRVWEATAPEAFSVHRAWYEENPERYGPEVRERLAQGATATAEDAQAGLEWRTALAQAADRLFAGFDLLATPAVPALHKVIGKPEMTVDGVERHYRSVLPQFSALVNHMGVPALVLPLNVAGRPAPPVQLIGPRWGEARLLAVGLALEAAGLVAVGRPPEPPET